MTSILEVEQLDTLSSNASSTLTIGGTNTTTINLGASGKSIVIPSGATLTNNGTASGLATTNGITEADEWRLTTDYAPGTTSTIITSNWERNDTNFALIGTGMSESSGIFSFPSTGIWIVRALFNMSNNQNANYIGGSLQVTTNNSTYNSNSYFNHNVNYTNFGGDMNISGFVECMIDVNDLSNTKVRFGASSNSANYTIRGSTTAQYTGATFMKLGET